MALARCGAAKELSPAGLGGEKHLEKEKALPQMGSSLQGETQGVCQGEAGLCGARASLLLFRAACSSRALQDSDALGVIATNLSPVQNY